MTDYLTLLLVFCRVGISFAFLFAAFTKLLDLSSFLTAVSNFRILPEKMSRLASIVIISTEILLSVFLLLKGLPDVVGFWLAIALLAILTTALASVLIRDIQASCNCYGPSFDNISLLDIIRNFGLLSLAIAGLLLSQGRHSAGTSSIATVSVLEQVLSGFVAIALVTIWVNLKAYSRAIAVLLGGRP